LLRLRLTEGKLRLCCLTETKFWLCRLSEAKNLALCPLPIVCGLWSVVRNLLSDVRGLLFIVTFAR